MNIHRIIRHLIEASHSHLADLQAFAAHCQMDPAVLTYLQKVLKVSAPYMGADQWMVYAPASVGGTANLGFTWASAVEGAAWEPHRTTVRHALSYTNDPVERERIRQTSANAVAAMKAWVKELEQKLVAIPAPPIVQNIQCGDDQGDPSVEVWFSSDISDDWWEEGSAGYDT